VQASAINQLFTGSLSIEGGLFPKRKASMVNVGDVLDHKYQIVEEIGAGGIGIVYKAYHLSLQKTVVVKKVKDSFVHELDDRIEVDILKKLHHANLPQVYDFLQIDNEVFTVMEYVDGYDLNAYLKSQTIISEAQLLKWTKQLLEVLVYLHAQNPPVFHSDIKPGNIMISVEGEVYLIDFNISLGKQEAQVVYGASEKYASPEQLALSKGRYHSVEGKPYIVDERSDVYSLAKSIWACIEMGQSQGQFYNETLCRILQKGMSQEADSRYETAGKMLHVLKNIRKQDWRYKQFILLDTSLYVLCALLMLVGIAMMAQGYKGELHKSYSNEISKLYKAVREYRTEAYIEAGLSILNNDKYEKRLHQEEEEYAFVLHTVGDGYYLHENYAEASRYYKEATEKEVKSSDMAVYYRDLILAKAKAGDIRSAREIISEAEKLGTGNYEIKYVKAEIAELEGNEEEARSIYSDIVSSAGDASIVTKAYIRLADLTIKQEHPEEAIGFLAKARERGESKEVLRRLGECYALLGDSQEALGCYLVLNEKDSPSYEDELNLALMYASLNQYEDALAKLKAMMGRYQEEYKVFAYAAKVSLQKGQIKDADYYYREARQLYGRHEVSGRSDELMSEIGKGLDENGN